MLLRFLLAFLVGWMLLRVVRRVSASLSPPPRRPTGRPLDPERAVKAQWSEEDEEGKDG